MSDLIDRTRFHSLTVDERQAWETRLREQFDVPLKDTVQFYVEGPEIVGVLRYKRDEQGRLIIHDGHRPEYYVLGALPDSPTCEHGWDGIAGYFRYHPIMGERCASLDRSVS